MKVIPLLLAPVAALALTACGNSTPATSEDDLARVRAASQAVLDAGTVRIEAFSEWPGEYAGSTTLSAAADFRSGAASSTYTYSEARFGDPETYEDLVVDGVWYTRYADYSGPNGEWIRDDNPASYEGWELLDVVDFEYILNDLESAEGPVERLGVETIRGEECTGFRVKHQEWSGLDLERTSDVYLRALGQILEEARNTTDVWLDSLGRPCRIAVNSDPRLAKFAARSGLFGGWFTGWTSTVDFFDYGRPVTITAPDPEDTVPWDSLD